MKKGILLVVALMLIAATAVAAPVPSGSYYTDVIGGGIGSAPSGYYRNDDAYFGPYALGFTLNYFGNDYANYYLNNNGNISFEHGFSTFTPSPLNTTIVAPSIAPYWADVDTRPSNGGTVTVRTDIANQIIVTWDQVGYYSNHTDRLASFQLVLRGPDYVVPSDEGQIGFMYKTVGWETGDASDGSGGFGGTEATVGFGDGLPAVNTGEISLAGSQAPGIRGIVTNNHYWFNLGSGGTPETHDVPEPATMLLLGLGLVGIAGIRRKFSN